MPTVLSPTVHTHHNSHSNPRTPCFILTAPGVHCACEAADFKYQRPPGEFFLLLSRKHLRMTLGRGREPAPGAADTQAPQVDRGREHDRANLQELPSPSAGGSCVSTGGVSDPGSAPKEGRKQEEPSLTAATDPLPTAAPSRPQVHQHLGCGCGSGGEGGRPRGKEKLLVSTATEPRHREGGQARETPPGCSGVQRLTLGRQWFSEDTPPQGLG